MKGVIDARKSLHVLQEEWFGCTACNLGELRDLRGGQQVFGAGVPRGIMFISSAPGYAEERECRAIGDKGGVFLARLLAHFRIKNYFITNIVACRSCAPLLDESGQPYMTKGYPGRPPAPRYKDQPAYKPQLDACAQRLYEEIYIVDPVLIVTFGQEAAAALRGKSFNLTKERGFAEAIEIPGAGKDAALSPKRKEWVRKVHGQVVAPTKASVVRYLMLPTLHPSMVRVSLNDATNGNPFELFTKDLGKAKRIYDSYNLELTGVIPDEDEQTDDTPYGIAEDLRSEDEADRNGVE